jgi:hypothetical protein
MVQFRFGLGMACRVSKSSREGTVPDALVRKSALRIKAH